MTPDLPSPEMAFWLNAAHETANTKSCALVAWGIYAGLRIARDGSLDDAHKEMAGQLFELRAENKRLLAESAENRWNAEWHGRLVLASAEVERLTGTNLHLRQTIAYMEDHADSPTIIRREARAALEPKP